MTTEQFERLIANSQPHQVFSLEWSSYSPPDFGRTFLPEVPCIAATALYVFDGADIFYDMDKTPRAVFQLYDDNRLVNFYCYTYPATVSAAQHKYKVSPGKYDCCMFVELSENEEVELSYRFGEYVFRFMEEQQGSYFRTRDLEERTVNMSVSEFRNLFLIH